MSTWPKGRVLRVRVNSWMRRTVCAPSCTAWRIMVRLSATAGSCLLRQQQLGAQHDDGEEVVEVVGHARGHLAEGPEPLHLHELVLGLLHALQRPLELGVEA